MRGAAQLAVRAQVPVRLVRIQLQRPFSHQVADKWFKIPENKPTFTIEFYAASGGTRGGRHRPEQCTAARQLTRFLTRALQPGPQ